MMYWYGVYLQITHAVYITADALKRDNVIFVSGISSVTVAQVKKSHEVTGPLNSRV